MLSGFFESVGLLTLFFSLVSHPQNHSRALMTVRPSVSTSRCKTLNIFIKVCYSLPCLPSPILADLPVPTFGCASCIPEGVMGRSTVQLCSAHREWVCWMFQHIRTLSPYASIFLPTPTP